MSEIHRAIVLRSKIDRLNGQMTRLCDGSVGGCTGWWFRRNRDYALRLFQTGRLRSRELPTYQEPLKFEHIPKEILDAPISMENVSFHIPDEILSPKPKKGRPRKYDRHAASVLRCTERHARRLSSTKKARQREREKPNLWESLILEKHREQSALMKALKDEEQLEFLTYGIIRLSIKTDTYLSPSKARQGANNLIQKLRGITDAMALIGHLLGEGLEFAARGLDCSNSTVRRRLKVRPQDVPSLLNLLPIHFERKAEDENSQDSDVETAWNLQTEFSPRAFLTCKL